MQIHGLIRGRSMVIPNGISESILMNPFKNSNDLRTAFLYFGSITQQHGVLEFIKEFYVGHKVQSHLYIIGGGPLSMVLTALIDDNNLSDRVHYLGYMTTDQMDNFIRTSEECFIGIAPYRIDGVNDHVYYGDSLKLKEYLAYYIPFLVSDIIEVPVDLTRFGVIYKTDAQLLNYLLMPSSIPPIGDTDVHNVLLSYTWNTLCSRIPLV